MTIETLRQVPLFESLDDEAANTLSELLETQDYEPYKVIFRAGDPGDAMYLVEHGKIRISIKAPDGPEVTLGEFGPGDFFGEMALLDGRPRSANATTLEDSRLAVLSREHLLSSVNRSPSIAIEMLTAISKRLRQTHNILRNAVTRNVNEEEAARLTLGDRCADLIAEFGGSWKFIIGGVLFFNLWMLFNTVLLTTHAFDPYPFLLLSTGLNMIAALQAPIIMMSQNRQSSKDRLRAEVDYQVNLKNELVLTEILQRLKKLEESLPMSNEKPDE
jgi:CRP/FNR family transcriptional regulator, cyclic AMP receptor protein